MDFEYYLPGGGILQAGVFDKEFQNYIFRSAKINVADGSPVKANQILLEWDPYTFSNSLAL